MTRRPWLDRGNWAALSFCPTPEMGNARIAEHTEFEGDSILRGEREPQVTRSMNGLIVEQC